MFLFRQEPIIAKQATLYVRYLIPSIFAYGIIQNLMRFLQTQSVIIPMMFLSAIPMALHFLIVNVFVHWIPLGFKGAPLAVSFSLWISVILLATYVLCSEKFEQTWQGFSFESFSCLGITMKLALPSAAMVW